ncbi:DMSO/TMAO reductase YedYZ molybdopterin-dependent catalytic subunit [Allocatelliglobosispora scoriae]|uniref:DMSO/TMAO reductase YedYZ molybdopterin-dependent catalytic subunit n=1 Tax=Allocatelliglobosispora scoriae TaxID=643052 RepID=A0A841BRI9_9ACTN|nr:molybdopterin-dependent oxidoreductase [Allocatelliglobosispora scoriae]MBB5869533.1 DMSO/TMAO reductase YedYZ molybdopterin-dependent catalytic subunit [Allocatelliglobosispora scoriae]
MKPLVRPAFCGLLSAAAGLAAAELVASLTRPEASPLVTIGGSVIDATPTPVKEWAVRNFGTNDKPLLLTGIVVGLVAFAAFVGILASRKRTAGLAAVGLFGVLGVIAALSRPAHRSIDVLAPIVGGVVAVGVLAILTRPIGEAGGRRRFLTTAAIIAGGVAVAGAGAAVLRQVTGRDAQRARDAIKLPAPADAAKPQPNGSTSFFTPNGEFYRVDTSLTVPTIDVESWQVRIHGMVDRPMTLTFADLLKRPLTERDITLNCVSNEVGGPYIGNAKWLGVPLAGLLREAGIQSGADQIISRATEGMTIGTPVSTVLDGRDAMLAIGMNGEPLPLEHGFPMRMLTPGLYGYVGACKWIVDIELGTFADFDPYWVKRGWAAKAPVKTASRIDRPLPFAQIKAGEVTVAGVAWAQTRGITSVQLQIDGGQWVEAELIPVATADTWVQWRYAWKAPAGGHSIKVRAIDKTGDVQTEARATPFPDGATGLHTVAVTVT